MLPLPASARRRPFRRICPARLRARSADHPTAASAKLNRGINAVLDDPETKARFRELNLTPAGGTPEDMARLKKEETERWSKVIRDAGIQPQ